MPPAAPVSLTSEFLQIKRSFAVGSGGRSAREMAHFASATFQQKCKTCCTGSPSRWIETIAFSSSSLRFVARIAANFFAASWSR
jgi:alkanesulfonate monooxygenase SsuD/methylene tetrahydromethanopterin reductase-like flavin-dependent oxidoreductase (luciferase family)